jgi:hypothetical protein
MTTQLLFYDTAVPVNSQRHRDLSLRGGADFGFARRANSVPLTAVEVRPAAAEYVVVFTSAGESVMPAAVLGVEPALNLFVKDDGTWDAAYVPAFVRRYPFVFADNPDATTLTLCIDESFGGCNREGRGERLFDSAGERTGYLETVLSFVKDYQIQLQRTQLFCKRLNGLGLLEPMQARFALPGGAQRSLTGFMAVSRTKLKALDRDTLGDLAASDELELIYLHLHSLQHFNRLVRRVGAAPAAQPVAAGDLPPPEGGDGGPSVH